MAIGEWAECVGQAVDSFSSGDGDGFGQGEFGVFDTDGDSFDELLVAAFLGRVSCW